ncbi:DNA-directed RNA polymerase subunit E'' [Candidatus Woesearchaeota archaeon]|jgi:RNA polymerase subunit RPABC4/transcription elongation factor Spt4|nr:DNA-directed RNA polymerase subunit E'' [Candidatus Woesearchaeota archaeon]MBT5272160.1 DNA-directed RNA polymerase subunit E'' [Candidatus Woesearchaeota archaeon]MBT6040487.1 DNA-directed RNA polymerase subunit E'' [Candidatus Woesearchaeota archaeon]MBT6336866.1 DNA-directed RNA polymerase subunit E'' [Candidatus Woesearchaeota archaeon]MBT7927736.1 DNA-directed RNA polymerase subunit E'' [Candidatus Woesearchaeota archaeon]
MARKVCKRCKLFVNESECPECKTSSFSTNWQGRLFIADPEKSFIAKQVGIAQKGEYAIKVK